MRLTSDALGLRCHEALRSGALDLPAIGGGDTAGRWRALREFGREDLSYARLIEPHIDALAILDELHHPCDRSRLHAVWASGGPDSTLRFEADRDGGGLLVGRKAFCSGAELSDKALITAASRPRDHGVLVRLDLSEARAAGTVRIDDSIWHTPAFAATGTASVTFESVRIPAADVVGTTEDYLERPGFWHGSIGPAAVWVGGLLGLVDAACAAAGERHAATMGHLHAACWSLRSWLDTAGREIDQECMGRTEVPMDQARRRAITVRHLVQRSSVDVVDRATEVLGPRGMAFDDDVSRRLAEIQLYVRQFHGSSELVHLRPTP